MDLFVINRHGEEKPQSNEEQEKAKLDQLLHKVKKRKKQQRIKQKDNEYEPTQNQEENNSHMQKQEVEAEAQSDEPTEKSQNKKHKTDLEDLKNVKDFTILGLDVSQKKEKATRVLPRWLTNPTRISSNLQELTVKVSKLRELDKSIRNQLKKNGVKYLFPVQAEVIPWLLHAYKNRDIMIPRDICVSAPTGSGKTLAFVLPVIQALQKYTVKKIRALVILPTQELAEQVFKSFKTYTQGTNIEAGLVSGKHLFSAEQRELRYFSEAFGYVSRIDILVCTAGRLVSHMKTTEGLDLKFLEFLIIDEADRVLENVQDDWLYHLEKHIRDDYTVQNRKVLNLLTLQRERSPQKLLFSATLTQDPEKIEKLSLFQPKLFTSVEIEKEKNEFVGKFTTPKELTEKFILCSKDLKPLVLYKFIKKEKLTKTLVFTNSVESGHRLKILLTSLFKNKLKVEEISSSLKGKTRDELISSFSKGEIDVLVCTDFLARGIDLPGVSCVISYSAPKFLKTYIHRSGRTARAGEFGLAVTLLHKEQLGAFKNLIGQLKKDAEEVKIDEENLEKLGERYKKALGKLKEAVMTEKMKDVKNVVLKKKTLKKKC